MQAVHAVAQDIGKTHQHRQGQAVLVQAVDQAMQVDGRRIGVPARPCQQVAIVTDIEIAGAPAGDVVLPAGVIGCPVHDRHDNDSGR